MINTLNRTLHRFKLFIDRNPPPGGFRFWITLLSLTFVLYTLCSNSGKLTEVIISENTAFWLVLGFLIGLFSLWMNAIAWKILLSWLGYSSNKLDIISLYLSSNLLKYLPGGIWHFVERLRGLRNYMGADKALSSVLLEPLLMAAAALLLVPFGGLHSGAALVCTIPAIFFAPRFRQPLIRSLESLKANQLERLYSETRFAGSMDGLAVGKIDYPFKALSAEMLFVVLRFGGFLCCLKALSIDSAIPLLDWLAAFSLAWTIGLVVPAAPGGVGVFEAALLIRVGSFVPEAPLLLALICYRFLVTLGDLMAAFGVSVRRRFVRRHLIK